MCVCVFVCVCVSVSLCVCSFVCTNVRMNLEQDVCVCVCVCGRTCVVPLVVLCFRSISEYHEVVVILSGVLVVMV